jgi:hypothetical protein
MVLTAFVPIVYTTAIQSFEMSEKDGFLNGSPAFAQPAYFVRLHFVRLLHICPTAVC